MMSDTPKLADESKKLLDNGWTIVLRGNGLGSYTAIALDQQAVLLVDIDEAIEDYDEGESPDMVLHGVCLTDDFEPSQALYRLTEKVFGRIA
jgi:hypothetical protein